MDQQTVWSRFLQTDKYDLVLKDDPGHGELSRGIRHKLEEVTKRYERLTGPQLNDATHAFPEWKGHYVPNSDSSFPYDWEEVMAYQGKTFEEIQIACKHEETRQTLEEIFGSRFAAENIDSVPNSNGIKDNVAEMLVAQGYVSLAE